MKPNCSKYDERNETDMKRTETQKATHPINPLSPPCIPPNPGFRDLPAKANS